MEILAPAGNREALDRAVAAGADAVYLGYALFSARAGAGNFDAQQLREAVEFAHLHHVRVHVTVNTLIKDDEMDQVLEVLRLLNETRVDAVLIQDAGVLRMCRKCLPDLRVHASTQMALHNAAGMRFAKQMGMTRAVLARECSVSEIRKCADEGIEIEAFGHGAQCVSVSGECLFSSMVGQRSGNRGRCAQPCRLQYTYQGENGAWLSPRDVCMRDRIPEMVKAGVCSLKLEGRLKRPEYVAVVASSYRRGADLMEQGSFAPADPVEKRNLLQAFQRGGFMNGYAMGAEDAGVIDPTRVNHGGVPIGTILSARPGQARCILTLDLHDGDSLQLRTRSGDQEMIYSGPEVKAGDQAALRLRQELHTAPGDAVIRLTDNSQLEWARALPQKTIPVTMWLDAAAGQPLTLTVSDGEQHVTVTGGVTQQAQKRVMTEEDAVRSLCKTGDTAFIAAECFVHTQDAFVPVSVLNQLRRDALEQLAVLRRDAFAYPVSDSLPADEEVLPRREFPSLTVYRTAEQRRLAAQLPGTRLAWEPEDWREEALESGLASLEPGTWLQLPMVCEQDTLDMICRLTKIHRDRLGGVVLGSIGQLGMIWPVPFGAGTGIPVMNRRAAQLLFELGCEFVTASQELTQQETARLMENDPPILVPAYGRTQLMLLHHCPARTRLGLTHGHRDCTMCDKNAEGCLIGTSLQDRRGYSFPLQRIRLPEGCLIRLLNTLPTDLLRQTARFPQLITLTTEQVPDDLAIPATSGHWSRPVE